MPTHDERTALVIGYVLGVLTAIVVQFCIYLIIVGG